MPILRRVVNISEIVPGDGFHYTLLRVLSCKPIVSYDGTEHIVELRRVVSFSCTKLLKNTHLTTRRKC